MNFGGPVWHASTSGASKFELHTIANRALMGVGDSSRGEWTEWGKVAFHLRRRLSLAEQSIIGRAVDIRGTEEAIGRWNAVKIAFPNLPEELNDARLIG